MSSKEFMEGTQRFIGSPGGAVPVVRALATDQIARSFGVSRKKRLTMVAADASGVEVRKEEEQGCCLRGVCMAMATSEGESAEVGIE